MVSWDPWCSTRDAGDYLGFCSSCPSSPCPDTLKEGHVVKTFIHVNVSVQTGLEHTFWAGKGVCAALQNPISGTLCHSVYDPLCPGSPRHYTPYRHLSCRKTLKLEEEIGILLLFWPHLEALTFRALRYAALFGPYVGVCSVAPWTTGVVVGIPAEVLPQVLRWVPIRIKPTGEQTNIIESVN